MREPREIVAAGYQRRATLAGIDDPHFASEACRVDSSHQPGWSAAYNETVEVDLHIWSRGSYEALSLLIARHRLVADVLCKLNWDRTWMRKSLVIVSFIRVGTRAARTRYVRGGAGA